VNIVNRFADWRCTVFGKEPTFDAPLANATVEVGSTAILPCAIDYLGKYKVYSLIIVIISSVTLQYEFNF